MELYWGLQAPVNDYGYDLPDHLHKAYSTVLTVALGDKENVRPRALCSKPPCLKHQLYHIHDKPPPERVGVLFFLFCSKKDLQVLRLHLQVPPRPSLDERASQTIRFTPCTGPCIPCQLYLPGRVWVPLEGVPAGRGLYGLVSPSWGRLVMVGDIRYLVSWYQHFICAHASLGRGGHHTWGTIFILSWLFLATPDLPSGCPWLATQGSAAAVGICQVIFDRRSIGL